MMVENNVWCSFPFGGEGGGGQTGMGKRVACFLSTCWTAQCSASGCLAGCWLGLLSNWFCLNLNQSSKNLDTRNMGILLLEGKF